ncbi:hypothetical protein OAE08_05200 [Gammaproteobacteria bacterium]|nr:hypothetical protein [Gammaproteobacteria bacterium]
MNKLLTSTFFTLFNTAELTQTFSRQAVDFCDARIALFTDVVSLNKSDNVHFLKNYPKG